MTAKELRRQAEYLVEQWDSHDKFRTVEGDAAFMNADGEPDAVTFARHILSTVRDDDDELVTYEWLCSTKKPYLMSRKVTWNFDGYTVSVNSSGARLHCNHMPIVSVQTRGQFRSLCRGLGIVLEEKSC